MQRMSHCLFLLILWLWALGSQPLFAQSAELYTHVDEQASNLSDILAHQGPDSYQIAREKIAAQLKIQYPQDYFYWLQKIEAASRVNYIEAIAAKSALLDTTHPAYQMYLELIQSLTQNKLSFDFVNQVYYSGTLPSRGIYFHDTDEIQLQLLTPDEMYPVLIHELTHAFDDELNYARGDFENDLPRVEQLLTKPVTQWSNEDKIFFGHYYFIKTLYLPYLKEIKPRLEACQAFTDLRKAGGLTHASHDDLAIYVEVLRGQIDCHEWVVSNFESSAQYYELKLEHYWINRPDYLQLERDAFSRWRESLNLREFRIPFRYE
jgi:hypothetical protein